MIEIPERVKDSLRDGRLLKNYRFNVLDDQGEVDFTIDNEYLVSESVKFDERMCSGSQIKFGLCEGSSLEFQYFNKPNINKKQIQAFVDVQYKDGDGDLAWYPIPMGFFTVAQCPVQFETGIRKVTAYNKLQSEYLDQKANDFIDEYFADESSVHIIDILNGLLGEFAIDPYEQTAIAPSQVQPTAGGGTSGTFRLKQLYGPHVFNISGWWNETRPTLSSNINLQFNYQTRYWSMSTWTPQEIANDGVRVHVPDDMDYIDNAVYTFLMEQFADNMTAATAASITNELMTFVTGGLSGVEMKRWGFCIRIIFRDDTEQYYGHTLYQRGLASGTFADLNKQTFFNVKGIVFGQYLLFDYGFAGMQSHLLYATGGEHEYRYSDQTPQTTSDIKTAYYSLPEIPGRGEVPKMADEIVVSQISNVAQISQKSVTIDSLADVSLRDLQSAVFETQCQFGKLDRVTDLFSGEELNTGGLYPRDDLYPANDLYPGGKMDKAIKSAYSKLWTDTVGEQTFRNLIIKYKGLDENQQEKEFEYQTTVNEDGTTDYIMSDNWLFKNLIWTSAQIEQYAAVMVEKMQGIKWFPFELWGAGLPYLEPGDEIEIDTQEGSYTSYILQRQLGGIQNLQDTYINGELDIF